MGGGGSKETTAVSAAAASLGPDTTLRCHELFEKIAGKRYAVRAKELLVDTLGIARGVPDKQLMWLAASLDKRVGPDPHPPRQSHSGHRHRGQAESEDCDSNAAEDEAHCAMTQRRSVGVRRVRATRLA